MNKTASVLKRFIKDSQTIFDFDLTIKNQNYHFDNIVFGKFGVLNVVCLNKKGELYGNENDEFFALVNKKLERELVPNPIKLADENEQALRQIFAKEKIYNIKIESVIVIENSGCKPLFTSQKVPLLAHSALKKHLKQDRFATDCKLDIQQMIDAVNRYKQN